MRNLVFTLEYDSTGTVKCWVDTAFTVHHDIKSHTGGMMFMGRVDLNTKISTEAELVGVDKLIPQIIWTRYSLESQAIKVSDHVVYQDNQSLTKLKKRESIKW